MILYFHNDRSERDRLRRSIRRLEQDVLRMGALVEEAFRLSHQCLFARNLEVADKITALDDEIDQYYRQIELNCVTIMTLQAPVAQELRILSASMQLVRDLERIGDYAEDLIELAVKLFAYPPQPCMADIEAMSLHAQLMLATSLVALADLDATAGKTVKDLDDTVDDIHDQVYHTLAYQRDIEGVVEPILLLGLVIRHLERMADHATNIGQRVSYIVTGQRG
ncbi:MAG: phosphate signaling complex protein PhoU [Cyanophyceae cyanobacterium]